MIRKIQSIYLYYFHAWSNKLNWCFKQNKEKHFKRPCLSLKFESLIQNGSNPSGLSCISPTHSYCHVSCMHHIVAYCLVMLCIGALCGRFCPWGVSWLPQRRTISVHRTIRQATNHLIISIQSHVLAPALFYYIRTTRFKLLCATVVEPIPLHDLSLPQ